MNSPNFHLPVWDPHPSNPRYNSDKEVPYCSEKKLGSQLNSPYKPKPLVYLGKKLRLLEGGNWDSSS